ncbi:hypothetical protein GCM10009641_26910 [Mycobacterium cookii]|uniref:Uncharacterized protein n=1 Tax=Mycobacterium cookii TaxID=1775 RepID=A0A7I7KTD3_9MYCO|nr:hypothetical protein [Mycobacterium cookii]MCV7331323.1 hypothetical protein [Mycobacterium cookii]BBX44718.1 hypothetical protein MCOO_07330 [Mycobacterium cookii]
MGDRDALQAEVLIRALSDVRDKLISQMRRLEKHGSQMDALALRRDVNEAQSHIDTLRQRYFGVAPASQRTVSGQLGRM